MGLFYPSVFGIVGQKMTSLQFRSQGDPEDPHDEHYLMATQSKQDQVTRIQASSYIWFYHHDDNVSDSWGQCFSLLVLKVCRAESCLQTGWGFGWRDERPGRARRPLWAVARLREQWRVCRDKGRDGVRPHPGRVPHWRWGRNRWAAFYSLLQEDCNHESIWKQSTGPG